MFFGLSHVDIPVRDLGRARRFWADGLGFSVIREHPGAVDVEAGNVGIRLVEAARMGHPASVRLVVADPEVAARAVVAAGGQILYEVSRTPAQELVVICADPDDNQVIVWRELTEDELERVPDLPTTLRWDPEADTLMKNLVGHVPALFRGLARRKVTHNAEWLTQSAGLMVVDRQAVIRSYILSSARITRDRVRRPLLAQGINPDDYPEEFSA